MKRSPNLRMCFSICILLILFAQKISSENLNPWRLNPFGHQILNLKDPSFGGLSGITVSEDGNQFVAISDKAMYFKGEMVRNSFQKLVDIKIIEKGKILNSKGEKLSGRNTDSESIAKAEENGYFISFESNNRVMFHHELTSPGKFLPNHPDFKKLSYNDGLEALAVNNSGEVYAIPELPPEGNKDRPIYKLKEDEWSIIDKIKTTDRFKVTGVEFIDDRNLILLERKFNFFDGFQIRFRRILLEKDKIKSIQVLLESKPWEYYNLEGISKWKDENGTIYLTLISDDQFSPLLKTEIREFVLIIN